MIDEATPLPPAGSQVALWTRGKPPLFVGIFTVPNPEDLPEFWNKSSMTLVGIDHEYTTQFLMQSRGCNLVLNKTLSDKYDSDTTFPTIYRLVSVGTIDNFLRLNDSKHDDKAYLLYVLLQDAGDLRIHDWD